MCDIQFRKKPRYVHWHVVKDFTHFLSLEVKEDGDHVACKTACASICSPMEQYQGFLRNVAGIGKKVPTEKLHVTMAVFNIP